MPTEQENAEWIITHQSSFRPDAITAAKNVLAGSASSIYGQSGPSFSDVGSGTSLTNPNVGPKPWDMAGLPYNTPGSGGGITTTGGTNGGGGGGGGTTGGWGQTATTPWGGTIQFDPGGIVYKTPSGKTPEWMEANQDWLISQGYAMSPEQFGQHMGIDIYEPGYVPGSYYPSEDQIVNPAAFSPAAWGAVDQGPARQNFRNVVAGEQRARQQQAQINNLYDYFGLTGGGGGAFGGGFSGGAYDPYGTGGIPPVETGAYPTTPVFAGEPSFGPDPTPSDPYIGFTDPGLGALASSAPAGTRDRLRSWLAGLGYTPQGVYGGYGETSWQRPTGATGPATFTNADFNTITDPAIQQWIRWLMGKMGYSGSTLYPGAVAP